MTLREAIREAETVLVSADSPHPKLDAEALLLLALGREGDRAYLLAHPDLVLDCATATRYWELVEQRATGKPMQYITGHQEFWGLDFMVTPDVLIPRPETEHSVEAVIEIVHRRALEAPEILDVGTGSGCIAVALARALPNASVTALDISAHALAIARRNIERHQVRVELLESDLLTAVVGRKFDIVVSNPPYIGTEHPENAQRQVRDFEPALALWGGTTGLEIYERLVPQAHAALKPGGHLVFEIGYSIESAVRALLSEAEWEQVEVVPDLQGIPRVITAQKSVPGKEH
jgi:release factor glutamine methyltransferase